MYKHWNIGTVYRDVKHNSLAVLVAVSEYKSKSGQYLDFRYINSDKYIRQNASKALSRFEATNEVFDIETEQAVGMGFADRLFASLSTDGGLFHTKTEPKSKKRVSKQDVLERYANVIYVDFIKKCRIA